MSVTLQNIYDFVDDLRIDNTPGTVDITAEGLRAVNHIIRDMQAKHDWENTIRETTIRYCPGIKTYALPSDFKAAISLMPAARVFDDYELLSPSVFIRQARYNNADPCFAVDRTRQPKLYVNDPRTYATSLAINANDSYNGNGTWIAAEDTANVRTDTENYYTNRGSVCFDIDVSVGGSNVAEIAITSGMTAVDLSSYVDGVIAMPVYLPGAVTYISGMKLQIGSSVGNVYEKTVTTQLDGTAFQTGWNIIGFRMDEATVILSPNIAAIDYLLFNIQYSTSQTDMKNVRIGELRAYTYEDLVLKYYSYNMVRDVSAGTDVYVFPGDSTSDTLLLSDEIQALIEEGVASYLLRQSVEPEEAAKCAATYKQMLSNFMDMFPSKRKTAEPPAMYL